ncbi:MAG: hypothetical protein ACRCR2_08040 [Fusobacteriaceae bacterium]
MVGVVIIVKERKRVLFHSKLQRFNTQEERNTFVLSLTKELKKAYNSKYINIYDISDKPIPNESEDKKRGFHYCPYHGDLIKLKQGDFGSRVCPICGISEQDFYFKKYN